jgi:RHH-type transcriptional regulator, rel operon repressor / antitoxin RelB
MKKITMTVPLNPETARKMDLLAKTSNRSKSHIAAEAIEAYVHEQAWQIEAILQGIKEADKGQFTTPKQMKETLARWER